MTTELQTIWKVYIKNALWTSIVACRMTKLSAENGKIL